jgi:poly(hydroxyalkanoate) depolymerase family esterase
MWQEFSYSGPEGARSYFVYTPQGYQVDLPTPLIVMLHGCRQTPEDFAAGTQMNALADRHHFVVAYPKQPGASNHQRCWNWFQATNHVRGSGEPALIAGMVQAVVQSTANWTIDPARVYAAGLSAGGALAGILGCTYPDVFAAIGIHSGTVYQAATSMEAGLKAMRGDGPDPEQQGKAAHQAMGSFARVVPTIVFQGTNDYIVAPINGDQVVRQWMQTNRLASGGSYAPDFAMPNSVISGQEPRGRAYTVQHWNDEQGTEIQAYWQVTGMSHAWSGGSYSGSYTDPKGPDASEALYEFFMAHPMPQPAGLVIDWAITTPKLPPAVGIDESFWGKLAQLPRRLRDRFSNP